MIFKGLSVDKKILKGAFEGTRCALILKKAWHQSS